MIPLAAYEQHKSAIAVLMGQFFCAHLKRLHREFAGDLITPIILGEIGHHGVARLTRQDGALPDEAFWSEAAHWSQLSACNAHSISLVTGIPRETVRRNIQALMKKGWVMAGEEGGVRLTPACAAHFQGDMNLDMLRELLRVAARAEALLGMSRAARPAKTHP